MKNSIRSLGNVKGPEAQSSSRRRLIKALAGIPVVSVFPRMFLKDDPGIAAPGSTATESGPANPGAVTITGKIPQGRLGSLNISRMILGCNLIGGWSHARDLIYTDQLFRTYHSEEKIIETFRLAEQAGINTVFMVTQYFHVLRKYRKNFNSGMQSICQTMLPENDFFSDIKSAIDSGTTALYIHGGVGDNLVSSGRIDQVFKAVDYIKSQGFPAGMGAHSLETIRACEREKLPVDFYVKTFHHDRYWSAHPEANREEYSVIQPFSPDHDRYHDNMWDLFPARTAEFMENIHKPWFAFKVLAAGAIPPADGFRFAFENGADFITVGMFDFQIANNVNTVNKVLATLGKRSREWFS
jgi:hypothetical protein